MKPSRDGVSQKLAYDIFMEKDTDPQALSLVLTCLPQYTGGCVRRLKE